MELLSHPLRLLPNGEIATVTQDGDAANAEHLATLCLTEIGERPLEPGFGITDPTFTGFEPGEVVAGVDLYGPDVAISDVRSRFETDATQLVELDFA